MSHQPPRIGFFDSGLGGLTVWRAVVGLMPEVPTVYYGDTLHLPYGDKSDAAIQEYSQSIVEFLVSKDCSIVVIACNSASAVAGAYLEEHFPEVRFINVIDPVVAYLAQGSWNRVGLLGTRATVRSNAYGARLAHSNPEIGLQSLATPLLVPLIEDGFLGTGIERDVLKHYLTDPALEGVEALVPGCTHYPLLQHSAESVLGEVHWVDAPNIVAREVARAYEEVNETARNKKGIESPSAVAHRPGQLWYLSDRTPSFERLSKEVFQLQAGWEELRLGR